MNKSANTIPVKSYVGFPSASQPHSWVLHGVEPWVSNLDQATGMDSGLSAVKHLGLQEVRVRFQHLQNANLETIQSWDI